jgi:hypothetical protein
LNRKYNPGSKISWQLSPLLVTLPSEAFFEDRSFNEGPGEEGLQQSEVPSGINNQKQIQIIFYNVALIMP